MALYNLRTLLEAASWAALLEKEINSIFFKSGIYALLAQKDQAQKNEQRTE